MHQKNKERQQRAGSSEPRREAPVGWPTRFPLPSDTGQILKTHRAKCENLGLWLDRLLDWSDQEERKKKGQVEYVTVGLQIMISAKKRRAPMLKNGALQNIQSLIETCKKRFEQQRATYEKKAHFIPEPLILTPDYRIVVGFGAEHVLETNLCLHRIYGFPIIPGSAVKGVTRAWVFWEIAEQLTLSEDALPELERLLSEGDEQAKKRLWGQLQPDRDFADWQAISCRFYKVFGTTQQQGKVIFFDAYPTQAPKLELDILNPHYGRYYQGSEPPADYLPPVPSYFLTVAKGTSFRFAVASKDTDLANKAKEWLTRALTDLGIGGKTAAGYGYFVQTQ